MSRRAGKDWDLKVRKDPDPVTVAKLRRGRPGVDPVSIAGLMERYCREYAEIRMIVRKGEAILQGSGKLGACKTS